MARPKYRYFVDQINEGNEKSSPWTDRPGGLSRHVFFSLSAGPNGSFPLISTISDKEYNQRMSITQFYAR